MRNIIISLCLLAAIHAAEARAGESAVLRVAVAANFVEVAEKIADDFKNREGIDVLLVPGSSGKLTAQIINGAPFDLFLSADREHPSLLAKQGLTLDSPKDYAIGALVFVGVRDDNGSTIQQRVKQCRNIAIANPDSAPYGLAAMQTLEALGIRREVERRLVLGESVGQTMAFIASGAADCGFVGVSQIRRHTALEARMLPVAGGLHVPLHQSAAILKNSRYPYVAQRFLSMLLGESGRKHIQEDGYALP